MENGETLIKKNPRFAIFLWAIFTFLLLFYFVGPRTTQSPKISIKIEPTLEMVKLLRWNDPVDSILAKKVKWALYDASDTGNYSHIRGWAFDMTSKDALHDTVYLVLESSTNQRWISRMVRFPTQDVVNNFGRNAALANSGFDIIFGKKDLKNGVYRTGLLFKNKKTDFKSLYWLDYQIVVLNPIDLFPISIVSQNSQELQFNIYDIRTNSQQITIECWAFTKSGVCTSCKSYFTLRSPSAFHGAPAVRVPQEDVVSYFKDRSLLQSGLRVSVKKNALAKGRYRVGILQRDTLNNIDYFSETDRLISIGMVELVTPQKMQGAPLGTDTIRAFIDGIEDKGDSIRINGWAFINNLSTDFTETSLVLKSYDSLYSLETTPTLRRDIQSYFKLSYNVDLAGLTVKFGKKSLRPGEYQVCIMMVNRKTSIKTLQCLGSTIKI